MRNRRFGACEPAPRNWGKPTFTHVDVSNHLNHYLVSLLLGLMYFIPAHGALSVDAWRRPELRRDWLLHAQPLHIWPSARTSLPLLAQRWVAYGAAWAGFLFDTTIVVFLLVRRLRPFAYVAVLGFHAVTSVLFSIGMFPFSRTTTALACIEPSWPRRAACCPEASGPQEALLVASGVHHRSSLWRSWQPPLPTSSSSGGPQNAPSTQQAAVPAALRRAEVQAQGRSRRSPCRHATRSANCAPRARVLQMGAWGRRVRGGRHRPRSLGVTLR